MTTSSFAESRAATDGQWLVPLSDVLVDSEIDDAVTEAVRSGWWSMGPRVAEFEVEFARFCGTKSAIAVANGTAALHLALLALGCGPGDEVIITSLNFVAVANVIGHVGATPVFCDIKSPGRPQRRSRRPRNGCHAGDESDRRDALRRPSRVRWTRFRRSRAVTVSR